MIWRALAAFLATLALAGCGGRGGSEDTGEAASLWVTRDRGAETILTAEVPAGLTVLQALDREADIETRYAGRFVQSIGGVEGSLSEKRDWFYFVNGIEPDVGAAEIRLRPGDIAWWDFRSWAEGWSSLSSLARSRSRSSTVSTERTGPCVSMLLQSWPRRRVASERFWAPPVERESPMCSRSLSRTEPAVPP